MYATIAAMGLVALFLLLGPFIWCCICCKNAREARRKAATGEDDLPMIEMKGGNNYKRSQNDT